jgi:hypothetical protein
MEEQRLGSPGESTQESQESKNEENEAPRKKYDEQYELLVDELFAQYLPQTALEEANVIAIAVALYNKRTPDRKNAGCFDLQITTALAQLLKSKAVRRIGITTAGSRSPRGLASGARAAALHRPPQRCPRKALEFWTPPGEGGSPKTAEQAVEEDPVSAAILNWKRPNFE